MINNNRISTKCLIGVLTAGILFAGAIAATPTLAALECGACTPVWHVSSESFPTNLPPGGEGTLFLVAENFGGAGTNGSQIVLRDKLPVGLTAEGISGVFLIKGEEEPQCNVLPHEVTCTVSEKLRPYRNLTIGVEVSVATTAKSGEHNEVDISGGGASTASISAPIVVNGAPTPFGIEHYELRPENADGSLDTQAGSHPFQLTTDLALNKSAVESSPPPAVKDLHFNLPPGLIGNPTPFPQCTLAKFLVVPNPLCPNDTVVGVAAVDISIHLFGFNLVLTEEVPLFNLAPSFGEPARFGFVVANDPIYLDTSLRTGSDYGVTVSVNNITEAANLLGSRVTFWGVPGDPRHDPARGYTCLKEEGGSCSPLGQLTPPPLMILPSACTGPVHTTVEGDSWEKEGAFTSPLEYTFLDNLARPVGMDGCNQVPFTPSIKVTPDGQAGSTPTGLTVDEHVPQETSLNPTGLAESDVKGLSVTLPNGVALNPAGADGLLACSMEQIGLQAAEASSCPEASKIATVKIKTPLLNEPLEGAAYLATQDFNPFGSLVAVYVYAEDPVSGVRAKAAGEVLQDPVTGQLTAHFEGDPLFENDPRYANDPGAQFLPQTPFEDIELHFFGGDRAPLVTPALCGSYTTTGTFTPWAENGTVSSASTFNIVSGPNGSESCHDPLPFNPSLTAGTTSNQADGFSPFTMTMSREDGEQSLQGVALHMPPGVEGILSTVKLCGEAQADAGTCGPESLIGETIVSVGVGGDPYSVKGGKVYITGPYKGAPFGLSVVNPAKAGPFDLGQVVVRAKLEVNPETAAIAVTTDNEGPYKIPSILDGIPLEIKHVNVLINRPGFTFNATNCNSQKITGDIVSTQGTSSTVELPYQATNCAVLTFKPSFSVSTDGKTSRANGASLHVKLAYPHNTPAGSANIKSVKVDLPKLLPSRLKTLEHACLDKVFDANPAMCPGESRVGTAKAVTPLIPVPLEGPAYFVSHGGAKFPELIIVLSGYGVTVQLHSETFINKAGITSSTFRTIPDAPVGTFELTLPEGPFSALAAPSGVCKGALKMPTAFTAQNGVVIHENIPITATGCARHKTKAKHKKHRKAKKK